MSATIDLEKGERLLLLVLKVDVELLLLFVVRLKLLELDRELVVLDFAEEVTVRDEEVIEAVVLAVVFTVAEELVVLTPVFPVVVVVVLLEDDEEEVEVRRSTAEPKPYRSSAVPNPYASLRFRIHPRSSPTHSMVCIRLTIRWMARLYTNGKDLLKFSFRIIGISTTCFASPNVAAFLPN
jgi:hypothetical protein